MQPRTGADVSELDVEVARWLTSADGLAAVAAATGWFDDGGDALAVGTALRREGLDAARAAAVTGAATARRRARRRWPDADRLLFTGPALEQSSDPVVSRWRARRFADAGAVEDRCAGVGGDTMALAAAGPHVTASDLDAARLELLRHNTAVRGHEVATVVADALTLPPPPAGAVHADPSRRRDGRRLRRLADHLPSVPALLDHLGGVASGVGVAVVLSPAVDLTDPDLPPDAELEFVQVGPDLVEAVTWTGGLRRADARATATLLAAAPDPSGDAGAPIATRSRAATTVRLPIGPIGDHLLDVAPAAVRARLHDELGAEAGARRVAARRALLTTAGRPPTSPWWRVRAVEAVLPARAAAVKRWLAGAEARPVELVRHGVDGDLEAFRRAIGNPPGGPEGRRIELVRLDRGAVAVVTVPVGTQVPT